MSALPQDQTIPITLNGRSVAALAGETLIETAKRHGIEIPHLCYMEGMRPDGNCRACVVEVKGERVLAASCCRLSQAGMDVTTDSPRALHSQKMVLELLQVRHAGAQLQAGLRARLLERGARGRHAALRAAPVAERRPLASGDRGQSRRLHPVHALRPRLPRGAGQRRHRLRDARRAIPRSSSTSAIRWARAPASPAANACTPARPAR